jgi:putative component of membrane protein insertase Oxa1/YidC/SpoIIIJ protein YidD
MKSALLTLLLAHCLCGFLLAASWGPWEVPSVPREQTATDNPPLQQAVRLFQKLISPVDGPRCPMYPTCSAYSLQALHKHGSAIGAFISVDRLYREADSKEHLRPIEKWGRIRFYDPLAANDFWLNRGK